MACLLPVFAFGAKYFHCGDAMLKYSTIAYLADSENLEYLAAGLLAAYTMALSMVLNRLVPPVGSDKVATKSGDNESSGGGGRITVQRGGGLYEPLLLEEEKERYGEEKDGMAIVAEEAEAAPPFGGASAVDEMT